MTKINLGKGCDIDLKKLLKTRLLLIAGSGAGKTWTLRRVLEQSHGKIQQIVLDLEGDFSSLREKFDYLLIGKDGDIPISIKTAEIMAKKLLELNVSAIIDLYELKHHERITFVKRFLDAMINAPKELWHPVMLVIDEIHIFAPQDTKCESTSSVIDVATRGRKRGICLVGASQRPAMLEKNVSAQCVNKLVGRVTEDVDMKRAGYELHFTTKEEIQQLESLQDGEFFAKGIAITNKIQKVKIGGIQTKHYEAGSGKWNKPPNPTSKIKAVLSKLVDLSKEAELELKTIQDYKTEISRLKFELRKQPQVKLVPEKDFTPKLQQAINNRDQEWKRQVNKDSQAWLNKEKYWNKENKDRLYKLAEVQNKATAIIQKKDAVLENLGIQLKEASKLINNMLLIQSTKVDKISYHMLEMLPQRLEDVEKGRAIQISQVKGKLIPLERVLEKSYKNKIFIREQPSFNSKQKPIAFLGKVVPEPRPQEDFIDTDADRVKGKCPRELYRFLYFNPDREFSKVQVGIMTGYSPKSGGFNNAVSALNASELIKIKKHKLSVNDATIGFARQIYGDYLNEEIEYNKKNIMEVLGACPRKLLEILYTNPESKFTKEELAEQSGYSAGSGGFNNAVSKLNSMGLINREDSEISLSDDAKELI